MPYIVQRGDHYEWCHSRRTEAGPRRVAVNLGPCQTLQEARKYFFAVIAKEEKALRVLDAHEKEAMKQIAAFKKRDREMYDREKSAEDWKWRLGHFAVRYEGKGLTLAGIARERTIAQRRLDRARKAIADLKAVVVKR